MRLILSQPGIFVIFCLLLGLVFALLLYRKDKRLEEFPNPIKVLLFALRALGVAFLFFYLLEPLLEQVEKTVEKPIVVLAVDNSESILMGKDSTALRNEISSAVNRLQGLLSSDYSVDVLAFSGTVTDEINFDFTGKETDVSALFADVYTRYYNRNLGSVVLFSDGIVNKGSDPLYTAQSIKNASVYTVALGDTTLKRDALIENVAHNRIAFLGNEFPLEVAVRGIKLKGERGRISVSKQGKELYAKEVEFSSNNSFQLFPVRLNADKQGLVHYTVKLSTFEGELNLDNNTYEVYVNILENKQKVLILAQSPHPDVNVLKDAIQSNQNYKVDAFYLSEFTENPQDYSLVIFHRLPAAAQESGEQIIKSFRDKKIPALYVLGEGMSFDKFNQLKTGVQLIGVRGSANARPVLNDAFSSFVVDNELKESLSAFPDLTLPFAAEYRSSPSFVPLFFQRIGSTATNYPLLGLDNSGEVRTGVILGEGIWRWRLSSFQKNKSHTAFNSLATKLAQYLSVKEDKSLFRVFGKNEFSENEPVILDAEVYNESLELITNPDVSITIVSEVGREYPMTFSRFSKGYRLNAGVFPSGAYRYIASVTTAGKRFTKEGEFLVKPVQLELNIAVANHQLLYNLALQGGGEMTTLNQMEALAEKIKSDKNMVGVTYSNRSVKDFIDIRWFFAILVMLFAIEWFLRKRFGAY
ncbi:MAG: vWA domain-containing protein [Flavobacteriales bacterium]